MENNLSILIVDDIPENIQVAANLLKDEGYDIAFALDGSTAIEHLKNHYYDLVLLDIMMPGMDGFEVCRRIKEDEAIARIPVIFLTAKHDIESVKKGFKLGAVDYVSKPFNAEELLVRVNNHLKLVEQQKELERLNFNQKRFLSIISHDIKEPLSSVLGFSKLLKKQVSDYENEKIHKYVDLIDLSARNGFSLLNNLLEWSRTQLDSKTYNPEYNSFTEIYNEAKEQHAFNIERKSIHVEAQIKQDQVWGDKNMLQTILRNLLANAIKYSEKEGRVWVTSEAAKNGIIISVKDNGVGMSKENQEKLFNTDEHLSTPGTGSEKGAGIGLILVKDFVDRHGGTIDVESEPKKGSEFRIFLPDKQQEDQKEKEKDAQQKNT